MRTGPQGSRGGLRGVSEGLELELLKLQDFYYGPEIYAEFFLIIDEMAKVGHWAPARVGGKFRLRSLH